MLNSNSRNMRMTMITIVLFCTHDLAAARNNHNKNKNKNNHRHNKDRCSSCSLCPPRGSRDWRWAAVTGCCNGPIRPRICFPVGSLFGDISSGSPNFSTGSFFTFFRPHLCCQQPRPPTAPLLPLFRIIQTSSSRPFCIHNGCPRCVL